MLNTVVWSSHFVWVWQDWAG